MKVKKIIFCGGGTGGHLVPGLAVAAYLQEHYSQCQIRFIGSKHGLEHKMVPAAGFALDELDVLGLYGVGGLKVCLRLLRLLPAFYQARGKLQQSKPDLLVGLGGFAAGLPLLAGISLRLPFVLLEQNVTVGVTNRVLAPWAQRIFAGFQTPLLPQRTTVVTGNPTRPALLRVRQQPYQPAAILRLLVLGGSQGARAINNLMLELRSMLRPKVPLLIVHQTGEKDFPRVQAALQRAPSSDIVITAIPFIDDMASAFAAADLVLCRSGAMTLAELAIVGRPSLLVPLPTAAQDHQRRNAEVFVKAKAAQLFAQETMNAALLMERLWDLTTHREKLLAMAEQCRLLGKPEATASIAAMLMEM